MPRLDWANTVVAGIYLMHVLQPILSIRSIPELPVTRSVNNNILRNKQQVNITSFTELLMPRMMHKK
jgi:hypothetical protein